MGAVRRIAQHEGAGYGACRMHDLHTGVGRYGFALLVLAAAALARWLFDPLLGDYVPFMTIFVAVACTGLLAGAGPAAVVAVLGAFVADYLFMPPREELIVVERGQWLSLMLYFVSSGLIVALAVNLRRSKQRLERVLTTLERDMVERDHAEAALRESEARLQAIIDNSPLVLFIKDLHGRYLMANRSYLELFDTTADELLGLTDYDRFPKSVADEYRANDLNVIESGEPREFEESSVFDGVEHSYVTVKFPLRDKRGIYAVCGISADITDQKRQQQALMEIDRRKDEFLSMLAHELRNPLAPIVSAVELLRLEPMVNEPCRRAMEVISRQAAHLTRLVDDLLDIARINTGRIRLQRQVVDVVELAGQSAENLAPRFAGRDIDFTVSLPPEPLPVNADGSRVVQVIDNLLDNAAKYTDPGGQASLVLERAGDRCALRVRDTGMGIEPPHLARIFDLFEQEESSLDRSSGGLGLGLHLVKRMVEKHGGRVEVRSAGRGRGSEFTVWLPLVEGEAVATVQAESAAASSGAGGQRILIVEDNADAAQSMSALLGALGHEVRVVADGREGVSVAEEFQPELALVDLGLPGIDGYEVARRLRTRFGRSMRLVALTGYGQPEHRKWTREAGFDAHLVKPASLHALNQVLSEVGTEPC